MAGPIRAHSSFPAEAANFRRDRPGNPRAGSCTLCRSSKASADKPCVALGPNAIAFREGMVVVCFNCAVQIGGAVGMLSQADAAALREQVAGLEAELASARLELEALAELRSVLDKMSRVHA